MNFNCGPVSVWLNPSGDSICSVGDSYEAEARRAWATMVRPGSWAIDVGAHTGLYAIAAAKLGAKAIAVEPQPKFVQRIYDNARDNDVKLSVFTIAASDREGEADFAGSGKDTDGIYNPLVDRPEWVWTTVRTARLDDLVPLSDPVSAIKIDVERHELQVLAGCQQIIERWRPQLLVEALDDVTRAKVVEFLTGYRCTQLDNRNLLLVPNA